MRTIRIIVALFCGAALAACSPGVTRFAGDDPAPPPHLIQSSPLPPPSAAPTAGVAAPAGAAADSWQPYVAPKSRDGHWNGATGWKYPPQQRLSATHGRELATASSPASDQKWASQWVSSVDRPAFDEAIRLSMNGEEGRWRSERGLYGTALPAVLHGSCSTVELMLSPSENGLPIIARGSIVKCS